MQRGADPSLPLVPVELIGYGASKAYIALAESVVIELADWKGRSIGFGDTPPADLYALLVAGMDETDIGLINVGFEPRVQTEA
jgi:ABC-type nitrate/sulfonate/bicarbonate transport system substrate-binding protein